MLPLPVLFCESIPLLICYPYSIKYKILWKRYVYRKLLGVKATTHGVYRHILHEFFNVGFAVIICVTICSNPGHWCCGGFILNIRIALKQFSTCSCDGRQCAFLCNVQKYFVHYICNWDITRGSAL